MNNDNLSNKFNFAAGLKTTAAAPFVIMLGGFMTVSGIMVSLISAMYTRQDVSLLIEGGNTLGRGFKDLFWNGPKEMVLSFTDRQKPQPPRI